MRGKRMLRGLRVVGVATALVLPLLAAFPQAANASGNAGYTTFDQNQGGCTHGSPNGINCNIYADKTDVYMNGGPTGGNGLADGNYYFAVLTPGSQNGGFIDGATGNLSDTTVGSTTGDNGSGDPVDCRTFTVSGGLISSYSPSGACVSPYGAHVTGTDPQGDFVIQLSPYDDTDNPGGVYIMAICQVGATSPSQCKFDMFKVEANAAPQTVDLTVVKNATPSFTRTCTWTVSKTVDGKSSVSYNITGTSKDLNYEVVYTKSCTDSAWQVNGNITVFNPNSGDATSVTLSDSITGSGTCLLDGQTTPGDYSVGTLAGGDSSTVNYTCSFTANPGDGTNTATATWDQTLSDNTQTPTTTASFDAKFKFGDPTTVVHDCVNVSDNNPGNVTWGTAPAGEKICATKTYDYTVTVTVPHGCVENDNTATFTVTDPDNNSDDTGSASTTAKVCRVPVSTGALTMGFWQNKNGQAIITKGSAASGVCNSGTFLRQFAPFQDLSSTATCTQVASYVTTVIKAASCSGPTSAPCNKMLKAQDLATTLDVYFSDPALGGNKIYAPAPIGGVKIDLTQVCNMLDGTSGSTCTGVYQDARSAFGNNTCLYVYNLSASSPATDILRYAASQSAVGGTPWYGTSKTLQVLAKNVFDSINNQQAFGC